MPAVELTGLAAIEAPPGGRFEDAATEGIEPAEIASEGAGDVGGELFVRSVGADSSDPDAERLSRSVGDLRISLSKASMMCLRNWTG